MVPLFVRLDGARVVGVGAGPIAAAKLLPLVEAGALVAVVAPAASTEVREAAAAGRLSWAARAWCDDDLDGAVLVVAGTSDAAVNTAVAAAAAARGTLCVRVDREGDGSADLGAVVRRGSLTLAVSTAGRAPALARQIRRALEDAYGPEWGDAVELYAELREDPEVRAALAPLSDEERRRRWRAIPLPDILHLLRTSRLSDAKRAARACLSSSSD
jgi:siroheme synthase-like protein